MKNLKTFEAFSIIPKYFRMAKKKLIISFFFNFVISFSCLIFSLSIPLLMNSFHSSVTSTYENVYFDEQSRIDLSFLEIKKAVLKKIEKIGNQKCKT